MIAFLFKLIFIGCILNYNRTVARQLATDAKGLLFLNLLNKCNCRCGISNRQDRILGGEISKQYEFPWAAYIQIKDRQEVSSGTLINKRYVITSASSLQSLTPTDVKVLLGRRDRCSADVSSTIFSVNSIIIHQWYSPLNRAHDIALAKINGEVDFDRTISPICLALPDKTYLGEVATIIGWTKNDQQNSIRNCRPLKLGLPILGTKECLGTSPDRNYYTDDKRCVGVVGATNPICKEDAGGAVMYRDRQGIYELVGILSDKNFCGNSPSTAMFTTISEHLGWITENTLDGCYCVKI